MEPVAEPVAEEAAGLDEVFIPMVTNRITPNGFGLAADDYCPRRIRANHAMVSERNYFGGLPVVDADRMENI